MICALFVKPVCYLHKWASMFLYAQTILDTMDFCIQTKASPIVKITLRSQSSLSSESFSISNPVSVLASNLSIGFMWSTARFCPQIERLLRLLCQFSATFWRTMISSFPTLFIPTKSEPDPCIFAFFHSLFSELKYD